MDRGKPDIRVSINVDVNGMLNIFAKEMSLGVDGHLTLK